MKPPRIDEQTRGNEKEEEKRREKDTTGPVERDAHERTVPLSPPSPQTPHPETSEGARLIRSSD